MISENNKRIAKNTAMLYFRMLLMMAVTLYTSRLVLNTLGIEDFGIYNLVGGVVVLFSFLNISMATATQRFINYELGKGNLANIQKIFSSSLIIHFILVFVIVILAETIGLWFLNTQLNLPQSRLEAANWVYQFSILTFCVNIIRVPYNATIIAYERMSFYAYISIVEAVLQLAIVYLLVISEIDKLIYYTILLFIVSLLILYSYYYFCRIKISVARFKFFWDRNGIKQLTTFSGWSLFGSFASVGAQQAINILLNIFYGVTINAAVGIANQLSSGLYRFISNFGTAFNPQIIQLYSAGKKQELNNLIFRASKLSYFLFLVLSVPVIAYCRPILNIWLGTVPEYTDGFCRLIILYLLMDAASSPLWIAIQATGKIRTYQITISILILLNIPFIYVCLKYGMSPYSAWMIRFLINVVAYIFRFMYLNKLMDFPTNKYIRQVVLVIIAVTLLSLPIPLGMAYFSHGITSILGGIVISIISTMVVCYVIGLNLNEKVFIKSLVLKTIKK